MNQRQGENNRKKYFMIKSPRKNVTDPAGSNPQPPNHLLDAHPTEPPRPAEKKIDELRHNKPVQFGKGIHRSLSKLNNLLNVPSKF